MICTYCQQRNETLHAHKVGDEPRLICPPCVDERAEAIRLVVSLDLTNDFEVEK